MYYRAWHDCLFTKQELGVFKSLYCFPPLIFRKENSTSKP